MPSAPSPRPPPAPRALAATSARAFMRAHGIDGLVVETALTELLAKHAADAVATALALMLQELEAAPRLDSSRPAVGGPSADASALATEQRRLECEANEAVSDNNARRAAAGWSVGGDVVRGGGAIGEAAARKPGGKRKAGG